MPGDSVVAEQGKGKTGAEAEPAGNGDETPQEADEDEDPSTRQIRVALEALRARRVELREANAEIDTLREQLMKAQGEADAAKDGKEFVAAYAADTEVLKNQLAMARTTLDEERTASKKLQTELAEEKKARSSLSADIVRLQTQLGSFSDGLKKLQARVSASTAELDETKKAKAELAAELDALKLRLSAAKDLEAKLSAATADAEEQRTLAASMQQELEQARRVASSHASVVAALQAQLGDARQELGRGREARLLMLGEVRAELEATMQGAWQEICQDLEQAPHRMLCSGPSAIRLRRPRPTSAAGAASVRAGPRIVFPTDESLVRWVPVTSFRDLKSDLWDDEPDANVECERCQIRGPKALGFMKKLPGVSEQARQEFLCAECNRTDAVENKRKEQKKQEIQAMDCRRNQEMSSFFPSSSPRCEAVDVEGETSSESYSESESSPPHSESPPPQSESSGGPRGKRRGGVKLRNKRARSEDGRAKRRRA